MINDKGGETLLTTTYFGPVEWYRQLYRSDRVLLEACESFTKQTYRNRCVIATANGPQALTVPVEHGGSRLIRDIRIKTACQLAKDNPDLRVSDIAYRVGFKDPKYFATSFKKVMGTQPKEYFEKLRGVG